MAPDKARIWLIFSKFAQQRLDGYERLTVTKSCIRWKGKLRHQNFERIVSDWKVFETHRFGLKVFGVADETPLRMARAQRAPLWGSKGSKGSTLRFKGLKGLHSEAQRAQRAPFLACFRGFILAESSLARKCLQKRNHHSFRRQGVPVPGLLACFLGDYQLFP